MDVGSLCYNFNIFLNIHLFNIVNIWVGIKKKNFRIVEVKRRRINHFPLKIINTINLKSDRRFLP